MRGWLLEARRAEAVRLGAQNFLAAPTRFVAKDEAVGVLAHAASVLPNLTHVVDAIAANADVNAVSILAPEHGFRGSAPAGEGGAGGVDPATGLPIRSVYRKTGNALVDAATRDGARTVVVDLQDVGTRFYTYIWTLYDLLVAFAAARHNSADADLRVIVLDRPNPLGGVAVQGPVVVECVAIAPRTPRRPNPPRVGASRSHPCPERPRTHAGRTSRASWVASRLRCATA